MSIAFGKLFWGFLLVLIEIHFFFIDILPDPIGYYLIYSGIARLRREFPIGEKALRLAVVIGIVSIPTIFIQQNDAYQILNGWAIYSSAMNILKLILVFYIFQLMVEVAEKYGEDQLIKQTATMFKLYISLMLLIHLSYTFMMNLYGDFLTGYTIVTVIIGFGMEIAFLVFLFRFRKLEDNEHDHDTPVH